MSEHRETIWLTIGDYARTRKISVSTVRRQIANGQLTIDRFGPRAIRIRLTRVVRSSQEHPRALTA